MLDSIDKRNAAFNVALPFGRLFMQPSAAAFDQADQQHLLGLFRSPVAGAAVVVAGVLLHAPERRTLQAPRRRR